MHKIQQNFVFTYIYIYDIDYAVILVFHNFHLGGQTNVAYELTTEIYSFPQLKFFPPLILRIPFSPPIYIIFANLTS